jgi:Spy/CpxP family protein refolding chaperone
MRLGGTRFGSFAVMMLLLVPLFAGAGHAEGDEQAVATPAKPSPDGPGRRNGPPSLASIIERQAERLGLDDATKAKVDEIANAAQPESEKLRAQLQKENQAMGELLSQEAPELQAVMKQADQIGHTETELQKVRLRTMLKIRALLTPEQRAELMKMQHERRGNRGHRPGGPPQ